MSDKFFADEHDDQHAGHSKPDPPREEHHAPGPENLNEDRPTAGPMRTLEDARMVAVMSYIPFLCFIPLLNMKQDRNAQFHARQGVILFLIEIVAVLMLIDPVSDFIFRAILLVAIAFSIAGIYFGLQGKNNKLPVIGDIAEKTDL